MTTPISATSSARLFGSSESSGIVGRLHSSASDVCPTHVVLLIVLSFRRGSLLTAEPTMKSPARDTRVTVGYRLDPEMPQMENAVFCRIRDAEREWQRFGKQ